MLALFGLIKAAVGLVGDDGEEGDIRNVGGGDDDGCNCIMTRALYRLFGVFV